MTSKSTLAMVTLVSATSATGCHATWDISPKMLVRLDGFTAGQTNHLDSGYGEQVPITEDTTLHFRGTDGLEAATQFQSISVDGPILTGIERKTGLELNVDVRQLRSVQASQPSLEKTFFATTGMVIAMPLAVGSLALLLVSSFSAGRPLRIPGQTFPTRAPLRLAHEQARATRQRHADRVTRTRLFEYWAQQASAECASIPAFLALARDLSLGSAPRTLVEAALQAAREEASHTELCTGLANHHADALIAANAPRTPVNTDADRTALIHRLVLEAFWDGCVQEGAAAIEARRSLALVKDETTRLALRTIAHDEHNHAELARDVIVWGLSEGDPSIRRTLDESVERVRRDVETQLETVDDSQSYPPIDEDLACEFGLAGRTVARAARVEAWETSLAMLAGV